MLNSGEKLKGYIWIVDNPSGSKTVYFKPTLYSLATEYTAFDLIYITMDYGRQHFASEAIPTSTGLKRELVEVHFKGYFTLISFRNSEEISFYIIDNSGEATKLSNTFEKADRSNRYTIKYNYEYRDIIRNILGASSKFDKWIYQTDFTDSSLSSLLKRYHTQNNLDYEIFPPPVLSEFFGASTSAILINHISDIDESFVSNSPFVSFSLMGGITVLDGTFEINIESSVLNGSFYHDHNIEMPLNITAYYEDITKATILSNGLYIGINPFKAGKFTPNIGAGISHNLFLNSSRSVTEELLYNDFSTVITNYYDGFQKPGPVFGLSFRAGVTYSLISDSALRLGYSYTMYNGKSYGMQSSNNLTISYIRNIF